MSKMLADLLGVNQRELQASLSRFELASGSTSVDVRLGVEIMSKVRQKTRSLGLDPDDTKPDEIYYALLGLVKLHDEFLARKLGIEKDAKGVSAMNQLRQAVLKIDVPKMAWGVKHSSLKRIIKKHVPKKTMKQLGFKSLDSMLKRTPVAELIAAIKLCESEDWNEKFASDHQQLLPSDFAMQRIEVIVPEGKRWELLTSQFIKGSGHNIFGLQEANAILILPVKLPKKSAFTITMLALILRQINEIRLNSAYLKTNQMRPDFGRLLVSSLRAGDNTNFSMAGQSISWRVVGRHFGGKQNHPETLEPNLVADDLIWRKAEETLYKIEPALHFWSELDYVAALDDGLPVSFNLIDVAINAINDMDYHSRTYKHFQDSLWDEVLLRYVARPSLERNVLKQLEQELLSPEIVSAMRQG